MTAAKIEAKKLRKVFGPIEAVRDVSFQVKEGEVLGFLGPNGAGKSTVMRMLTCFLQPTAGTASIGGFDILKKSMEARRILGYLPETNPVYGDMTPLTFLKFVGRIRGFKGKELKKRVEAMLETCRLSDVREQSLETLSKGYRRRVGLAQALLHDPPMLILDEPTDGLDPNQKHEVRMLIKQMAPNKATIISTHILEEVDEICTRAIIISKGKIVSDGTPAELKKRSKSSGVVQLTVRAAEGEVSREPLQRLPGVKEVKMEKRKGQLVHFTIVPRKGERIAPEISSFVQHEKWRIEGLLVDPGNLNEVFREITTEGGGQKA